MFVNTLFLMNQNINNMDNSSKLKYLENHMIVYYDENVSDFKTMSYESYIKEFVSEQNEYVMRSSKSRLYKESKDGLEKSKFMINIFESAFSEIFWPYLGTAEYYESLFLFEPFFIIFAIKSYEKQALIFEETQTNANINSVYKILNNDDNR